MSAAKLRIMLTGVLLSVVAGCQRADQSSQETSGPVDQPGEQNAAPEETSDTPEQEIVAAKITPPTVDRSIDTTPEPPKPLTIGDPAPALSIASWVTGEPIDAFEAGQVYVVEFWATWCGPCKTSMPHLSQLNVEYGDDVQVVGVTRESVDVVQRFLDEEQSKGKTWRDVVSYRLAADEDSITNTAYMRAAGQTGIPTAFIVGRDGIIEWIGHPMTMDQPLASVVSGDHDRSAALAELQQQQRMQQASRQLSVHLQSEEFDEALEIIAALEADIQDPRLQLTKLTILKRAGRDEEAAALQPQLVEDLWDNASALNQIAWNIAVGSEPKDLELALKAATQASELTSHESAAILDTLARVHYEMGDLDQAISWQKQAVEHGAGNKGLQRTLDEYQSAASAESTAPADSKDEKTQPENPSEEKSSDEK